MWPATSPALWVSWATIAAAADQYVFHSDLHACPDTCVGQADDWTLYSSAERITHCEEPLLLDFAIHNPINDPLTHVKLRSCSLRNAATISDAACIALSTEKTMTLDVSASGQKGDATFDDVEAALDSVRSYLSDSCDANFSVGYSNGAVVGVYSGASIDNQATASSVLEFLAVQADESESTLVQLCGEGRNADYTFGVAINTNGDIAAVQQAIVAWSSGTCVEDIKATGQLNDLSIFEAAAATPDIISRRLFARADCTTTKVVSGDSCGALATKCGISPNDFTTYNPDPKLCAGLTPGEQVCCSAGTLPDITPKQNSNGSCASYNVQSGDTCSSIAANNGLNNTAISNFNDKSTWGWFGCDDLQAGLAICLSPGTPPMPALVANALCGPTSNGTDRGNSSMAIADMNPCPLNACCNIWGQCGITPLYCSADPGPTGNPGTAPAGKNGCISNCGTNVTNNADKPSDFKTVGYYESWNWNRDCLNMRADSIDVTTYTHAHWGFATITSDFDVDLNDTYKQWAGFTGLYGTKKVISFGGWGYSTDPSTYDSLRTAMNPSNAGAFADNIVKFLNANNLDGVDFDWEYPGAPDIPGIPAGLKSDGPNYLAFLTTLRGKMPQGKTMSIAAPASYWYLKAFPIAEISRQLDYIVYMTYDLHGQWDYGNTWSQDGCTSGACLRSHVNLTETNYALAMITKAGVNANKITVGVSSYGRSFGMTKAGCTGPQCTFGGPDSTAQPGLCTVTPGYISNAELYLILGANETSDAATTWFDTDSNSDIMVYNQTQWVAFMSPTTKSSRTSYYQGLNFGGTIDWAVDLQEFGNDDGDPSDDEDLPTPAPDLAPCTDSYATLEDLDGSAAGIPFNCKAYYLVQTLSNVLNAAVNNYSEMMKDGYDGKFNTYSHAIADSAGSTVQDFVTNNGNKYFTCIISETAICCSQCKDNQITPSYCDYCFEGTCDKSCSTITGCTNKRDLSIGMSVDPLLYGRESPSNQQVPISKVSNHSEPCPPDYSQRGYGPNNPYEQSVYWSFQPSQTDQFYADLLTNTGIPKDKTKIGNYDRGQDCAPSAGPDDECHASGMDYDIPQITDYAASDVTNPKDVVTKALASSNNLQQQISDAASQLSMNCYVGDGFELVDTISLPVLMIVQAVENMAEVDTVADNIDEEKRKALILAFIGAILFFVPIAGEVLGAVTEMADIASIISILGAVGNSALDVYTIVDDPANAPLAVFSLILEPLALADLATISRAASIRRGMAEADVAKLGGKVADRMETIKKVTGTCHKGA